MTGFLGDCMWAPKERGVKSGFRRVTLRCLLDAQEEALNRPWTQAGGMRKRPGLEKKVPTSRAKSPVGVV